MSVHNSGPCKALSKDTSVSLKGIFAIMVLLHHFHQRTGIVSHPLAGKAFELLGFLSVSIFFFYSGFGLVLSFEKKGQLYLNGFLRNRVFPLYCFNVCLIALSVLKNLLIGNKISFADILSSLCLGHTVVTYGWYIQTILQFYLLFYLVFKTVRKNHLRFRLMVATVVGYIVVRHGIAAESATYISLLAFVFGMCCGKWKTKLEDLIKKKGWILLGLAVVFLGLIGLSLVFTNRHIRYGSRILAAPVFVVLVLVIAEMLCAMNPVVINNRITKRLGTISLEIYVAQGFFFDIFRSSLFFVTNSGAYILLVGGFTLVSALLLHPIFSLIQSAVKTNK